MLRKILIEARKKKGLKQKDVSDALGVSQSAYSNIEKGKRNPSVPLAKKIGSLLEIDWAELFKEI